MNNFSWQEPSDFPTVSGMTEAQDEEMTDGGSFFDDFKRISSYSTNMDEDSSSNRSSKVNSP